MYNAFKEQLYYYYLKKSCRDTRLKKKFVPQKCYTPPPGIFNGPLLRRICSKLTLKAHFHSRKFSAERKFCTIWLADTNFPSEKNFEVEKVQLLTMTFSENFLSVEMDMGLNWLFTLSASPITSVKRDADKRKSSELQIYREQELKSKVEPKMEL
jgi:hypothetical protein